MMKAASLIFISILVASGCVTVKLPNSGGGKRAEGVKVVEPAAPFARDNRSDVDSAWKNPRNGNAISYLSDCKDESDPPLEQIVQGVLAGLTHLHYELNEDTEVQGREARHVVASGRVDGVATGTELVVFKRNQCIYILGYVGVRKAFPENRTTFKKFVQEFRAP